MTFSELRAETAKLGFLPNVGTDADFLACANRAMLRVNGLRPRYKSARIVHLTETNLLDTSKTVLVVDSPISLCVKGAQAYAFLSHGGGILRIYAEKNGEERQICERILKEDGYYKGGIYLDATPISKDWSVRLEFTPQTVLRIESPACYAAEVLPEKGRTEAHTLWYDYDLAELCDDFLACEGPEAITGERYQIDRTQGERRFCAEAKITDAQRAGITMPTIQSVRIPTNMPGIYTVSYLAAPKKLTGAPEQLLDIPADLAVLVPLLCASECFFEEDPEKSAFYLRAYEAQAEICRQRMPLREIPVHHTNGW